MVAKSVIVKFYMTSFKYLTTFPDATARAIAITYRVFVNQENSAPPNLTLTLT